MRTRITLLILSLFAGACSDATSPASHAPPAVKPHWTPKEAPSRDETCKSGYSVATGRNGEIVCVPDVEVGIQAAPRAVPDSL